MCSAITHAVLGLQVARIGTGERMPVRYWVAAAALGVLPDIDGVRRTFAPGWNEGMWGHRGVTHSLLAAAVVGGLMTLALFPRGQMPEQAGAGGVGRARGWSSPISRWQVWAVLAAAMALHGLTDMLTNGGSGVAVFAPVSLERERWAFHPVEVSPMSVGRFFSDRGVEILKSEARWVLLPGALVVAAVEVLRRKALRRQAPR